MLVYEYTETYNASDIRISAYSAIGTVIENGVEVAKHSLVFYIDDVQQMADINATEATIPAKFTNGLQALKDQIDGVANQSLNALLDGLGFDLETQAPTPTNFTATPGATGEIELDWDSLPGVVYDVERAEDAGFTVNLTTVGAGATDPFTDTGLTPTTHYYYRNNSVIPGLTDSAFALADAIAP